MNGYYGSIYPDEMPYGQRDTNNLGPLLNMDSMDAATVLGEQSLDDIINETTKEMRRRRSLPSQYSNNPAGLDDDMRRVSIMEFMGAGSGGPLDAFHFNPSSSNNSGMIVAPSFAQDQTGLPERKVPPNQMHYGQPGSGYPGMRSASGSAYSSPMHQAQGLAMNIPGNYMPSTLSMQFQPCDLDQDVNVSQRPQSIYSHSQFPITTLTSPIQQDYAASPVAMSFHDPGGGGMDMNQMFGGQDFRNGMHSNSQSRQQSIQDGRSNSSGAGQRQQSAMQQDSGQTKPTIHSRRQSAVQNNGQQSPHPMLSNVSGLQEGHHRRCHSKTHGTNNNSVIRKTRSKKAHSVSVR